MFPSLNGRLGYGPFNPLADDIQLSFELGFIERIARDENLSHERLGRAGLRADLVALHRHVAPTKQAQAFLHKNLREEFLTQPPGLCVRREKELPDSILTNVRQGDSDIPCNSLQKCVGDL